MDWQTTTAIIGLIVGILTIIGYIIKHERSTAKRHEDTKAHATNQMNLLDTKVSKRHAEIYDRMRQLERDFQEYQLHVATRHMDKAEVQENFAKILGTMRELEKEIRDWLVKGASTGES